MIKITQCSLIIGLCIAISASANAEGFIKKEVYSFKDKNGNFVFTDRLPNKNLAFQTRTIEAANSTGNTESGFRSSHSQGNYAQQQYDQQSLNQLNHNQLNYSNQTYVNNSNTQPQTVRIVVEEGGISKKKKYKKKRSINRCKFYKKKFTYYSNKMKAGYKSSEYKKLEAKRKEYKNLLFNNCETKTFSD